MYEAFYGFREKPFNLTPDPKYLYLSPKHSEAFAHLEFGLKERGGFVVITGEVGTGKTTLCRYFLERLDENTASAFVMYPALTAVELLRTICDDLGIQERGWTAKEWVDILHTFLLDAREKGKNIVLVIDEAQNLDSKLLEQIRLISNLETTTEKLIQIVLIGQSELNDLLAQTDLRQLAQRVTARYHLQALNHEETTSYIRHRLGVVGGAGTVSFTPAALRLIHRFSGGIPRLINLVCDRALLAGFVLSRRDLDAKIIGRAVKELEHIPAGRFGRSRLHSWKVRGAAAAAVLAGAALAFRPQAQRLLPWAGANVAEVAEMGPSAKEGPPEAKPMTEEPGGTEELEIRLRTLSKGLSRRGAASAVLERWGVFHDGGVATSPVESLKAMARRAGLEVTELRTHFEQLQQLDLPAILELFHTARNDTCFVAMIELNADSARVSFGPGDAVRVPVAALERYWTRRAFVFWRDFEHLGPYGPTDPRVTAWVDGCLRELGFLPERARPSLGELHARLSRFQGKSYLVADGVAGPRTRMALYSLSGRYTMPRLGKP